MKGHALGFIVRLLPFQPFRQGLVLHFLSLSPPQCWRRSVVCDSMINMTMMEKLRCFQWYGFGHVKNCHREVNV